MHGREGAERVKAVPWTVRFSIVAFLYHLVTETWRTVLVLCVLVTMLGIWYATEDPEAKQALRSADTAAIAVYEQLQRAKTLPPTEITFIGDSSCLMGIDADALSRTLQRTVTSLCSIGFVGPAGYARMLQHYLPRAGVDSTIVILAIHPLSLARKEQWDRWTAFVEGGGPSRPKGYAEQLDDAINWLQKTVIGPFVQIPMRGKFGLYYGDDSNMRRIVRKHGQLVDPGAGLAQSAIGGVESTVPLAAGEKPDGCGEWTQDQLPNQRFHDQLADFRRVATGVSNVYVLLTPMPSRCYDDALARKVVAAGETVAAQLGVGAAQILQAPPTMAPAAFSSEAHLNRMGRTLYTLRLAETLDVVLRSKRRD